MERSTPTIAIICATIATAAVTGASNLKLAAELARRLDYSGARRAAAADTVSLTGKELREALLILARLETNASRAEELYRRVIGSGPSRESALAALELGKIAYARGEYRGAFELLAADYGERSGENEDQAAYFRGLSLKQLGDRGRSRAELASITRDDFRSWSLIALAEIEIEEGRTERALELYERATKGDAYPVARFGLGECWERIGDRERAAQAYRAIVRELPRSLEAAKAAEKLTLFARARDTAIQGGASGGGEWGGTRNGAPAVSISADRYTIQFGAFGSRANADAAAKNLEGIVPAVRIENVEMDGRIWHRVRAGVYESRSAAERDLALVREKLGISGTVVPLK